MKSEEAADILRRYNCFGVAVPMEISLAVSTSNPQRVLLFTKDGIIKHAIKA
jgi:hypothetical protein